MNIKKIFAVGALLMASIAFGQNKYKCLVQMKNYPGQGAYIAAYIVNGKGQFVKTLQVMGDDERWHDSLKTWHNAQNKKAEKLDAITGASVSGGKRNIFTIQIDESLMNKGNKIRFESAVEHGEYVASELEIPLDKATIEEKVDGKGYIRFVKINSI